MNMQILSAAALCGLLGGCVAVPVSDAGVHITGAARSGPPLHHDGRGHGYGRDRDRDGVPNRWDRRPNNPYRY